MTTLGLLAFAREAGAAVAAGVVFAAIGVGLLLVGGSRARRDRAIGRWPRASGTIASSRYEAHDGSSRDANGYDVATTSYAPVITYRYTVGGREFTGDRVARVVMPTDLASFEKRYTRRYPEGARVEVFYDPDDPSIAYLDSALSGGAVFLLVLGGVFTLAGAGALALVTFAR